MILTNASILTFDSACPFFNRPPRWLRGRQPHSDATILTSAHILTTDSACPLILSPGPVAGAAGTPIVTP